VKPRDVPFGAPLFSRLDEATTERSALEVSLDAMTKISTEPAS